ncbi:NADH-quinone oxidoreductase subunit C, partial [Streptomyces sp. WAC 05379]|uniref:NADH-quinone oxidoreductase subunit C n=1 Tax=Streptomyces sp. WAC 05379 TaxID=2203207 RepID=UPI0037D99FD4
MPAAPRGAAPGDPEAPGEDRARVAGGAVRPRLGATVDGGAAERVGARAAGTGCRRCRYLRYGCFRRGGGRPMTTIGWLPAPVEDLFGPEATAEESYEVLTVDVPPTSWLAALEAARDGLGCTYFDWLSAVDEPGTGFRVAAHVAALSPVRRLLVRTTVPHEAPTLPSAVGVYAGAGWHERETHEMFGVDFTDHPALDHLLLPENFEGHPLRKDFVLAARVAKAWPGAKEPGESEHGGPKRRQMLPPGVPDPNEWG